jgi:hypothetical protein
MSIELFISYDYDNDKHYKNLLVAWDSNDMFDFEFYDHSVDVSVNSEDANYVKRVIKDKISQCTHFLCIIGEHTWKSDWVAWEIEKAVEMRKKIVAVKIDDSYTSPSTIMGVGASWARSFTFSAISDAVDDV